MTVFNNSEKSVSTWDDFKIYFIAHKVGTNKYTFRSKKHYYKNDSKFYRVGTLSFVQ